VAPSPAIKGGQVPAQLLSSVVEPASSPSTPLHTEVPSVSLAKEYSDNPDSAVSKLPESPITAADGDSVCTGKVIAAGGVGVGAGVGVGVGVGLSPSELHPTSVMILSEAATSIVIFESFIFVLRVIIRCFTANYAANLKKLQKMKKNGLIFS
jgi:hypothetical protein